MSVPALLPEIVKHKEDNQNEERNDYIRNRIT